MRSDQTIQSKRCRSREVHGLQVAAAATGVAKWAQASGVLRGAVAGEAGRLR